MGKNELNFVGLLNRIEVEFKTNIQYSFNKKQFITSVDFLITEKGRSYLIEIDSYNMSKPLLGQFILLNRCESINTASSTFVVIHYYKEFDRRRSIKYLEFAKKDLNCQLQYCAFNSQDFQNIKSKKEFFKVLQKK